MIWSNPILAWYSPSFTKTYYELILRIVSSRNKKDISQHCPDVDYVVCETLRLTHHTSVPLWEWSLMVTRLTVTTLLLWLRAGSGLKVTEITAQAGSLSTSRHTELTCDFLKWKQEEFFSITWAVEHLGVKTDFLQYNKDGSESGSSVAIPQQEKYLWTCNL